VGFQLPLDRDDGDRERGDRSERGLRSPARPGKTERHGQNSAEAAHGDGVHKENRKVGDKYAKFRIVAVEGRP
jgi:hypothetical protein